MLQQNQSGNFLRSLGGLGAALMRVDSIAELRALTPLPDEAQRIIDTTVRNVGLERLSVVADILSAGPEFRFTLDDWLGTPEVYWETDSKVGDARRVMNPIAKGENQRIDKIPHRIPVFCTIDDFELGIRETRAAARNGYPMQTRHIAQAVRRVNEAIEDQAINGANLAVKGNSAPGLLGAPNKNTMTFSGNEAWTASGHDGEDIIGDVNTILDKLDADNRAYGRVALWVPKTYWRKISGTDYKVGVGTSTTTILQRLQDIETGRNADGTGNFKLRVSVADRLPTDTVVAAQLSTDVLDVIWGQEPIAITWTEGPGWEIKSAVIACAIVRVMDDYDGNSGIVVGTRV